ncbi:MAG TPA: hypothetical protein VGD13_00990 [Xanthobacteraceae bacterium]|jgi:hypothetical protein
MALRILTALVLVGGTAFGGTWAVMGGSPAQVSAAEEVATFNVASADIRTPSIDAAYPHLLTEATRSEPADQALLSKRLEQLAEARRVQLLGVKQAAPTQTVDAPVVAEGATKLATPAARESQISRSVKPPVAERKAEDSNVLTVAQIQKIKKTLKLSPDQEGYWPPVEAALRDIAREQAAHKPAAKKMTVSADASQKLYWAAAPLIMSLRYEQKHEARRLARSMGLEEVASAI